jgi:hypothetical protein
MMPEQVSRSLADLTRTLVNSGATVVVPEGCDSLLRDLGLAEDHAPSLLYADRVEYPGFHVMETTSSHWVEILTGLGATGAELILAYVSQDSCQGHVFVPVLQFSESSLPELDLVLSGFVPDWTQQLLAAVAKTAAGSYIPRALRTGNTDSQIPRGPWGFSV